MHQSAAAVSQWLFETPRRSGQPVDVRVVIPVEFKAPGGERTAAETPPAD